MIGKSKVFSKTLLRENDPKSRKVITEYLSKRGIIVKNNPNKFGVDLVSDDGEMMVEVEHRNAWNSEEFPFEEVNVPERKAKFFTDNNIHYAILSKDYSRIGLISGKILTPFIVDENLRESPNKYVKKGEYFYKVPRTAFTWDTI